MSPGPGGPAGLPRRRLTIAVPVYRPTLDEEEQVSLDSTFRVLGGHHLVMVKPEGLDTGALEARYPFAAVETFAPDYFRSIQGYNRLLLSTGFYQRFLESEYLLVCQLDVFVFHDDLAAWVERGYDYVGAPWISGSALSAQVHRLKGLAARLLPGGKDRVHSHETRDRVGNGGFSLRKTATHHHLSVVMADAIRHYLANQGTHHFHEDVFWSIEPSRRGHPHRTPSAQEALAFAFDINPARLFELAGRRLPMAAHGWYKRRHLAFWAPHVAQASSGRPATGPARAG